MPQNKQPRSTQPKFKHQWALRGSIPAVGPSGMLKHKAAVRQSVNINKRFPKRTV